MPSPLIPIKIHAPGSKGLNSQEKFVTMDPQQATVLQNAEFDSSGRCVARKGWDKLTTSGTPGAYDIESMHAYEDGTNTVIISAANNAIYHGTTTMSSITITPTVAANNWQFQTWINNAGTKYILAWQTGEEPMISTVTGTTPGTWAALQTSVTASGSGTVPDGNCVHVAFGRIWAVDDDQLNVIGCATLDQLHWTTGAFAFDTTAYWPGNSGDRITAITSWEDKLVVFGRHNILIYDGLDDPSTNFVLTDTVAGIGCVSRDSVQSTGKDLLFLSNSGIRSLRRTIQNEKMPVQEIGNQVRDDLLADVAGNEATIKSVYSEKLGMYLLIIKDSTNPITYMYDFKAINVSNQNGSTGRDYPTIDLNNARVSKWIGWNPGSVAIGLDNEIYGGFRNAADSNNAVIGKYNSYNDNASAYTFTYKSPWIDMTVLNPQLASFHKILKQVLLTTTGGAGYSPSFSWAYDHRETGQSEVFTIPSNNNAAGQWNVGKWGESLWGYTVDLSIREDKLHPTGSGDKMRLGVEVPVNGTNFGIQCLELFFKRGRLGR